MIITEISGKQFSSYRDAFTWTPSKGITGIVGSYEESLRSNGSGKTSLIMAIIFALYGAGIYKKVEDLVYDKATDIDFYAGIKFEMPNGNKYELLRGRKGSKVYLSFKENGNIIGDDKTTIAKKQEAINDIIGMNYDMFTATVFFEQRNADKFINADSANATEYLDLVLGITSTREVIKSCSRELKSLVSDLELKTQEHQDIKIYLDSTEDIDKLLSENIEVNKVMKQAIDEINKKILSSKSCLESYKNKKTTEDELESITVDIKSHAQRIDTLNKEVLDLSSSIAQKQLQIPGVEKRIEGHSIIEKDLVPKLKDIESLVETAEANKQELLLKKYGLDQDISKLVSWLSDYKKGVCNTCHQEVTDEIYEVEKLKVKNTLDTYNVSLSEVTSNLKTVSDNVVELKQNLTIKTLEYNTNSNNLKEMQYNLTSLNNSITTDTQTLKKAKEDLSYFIETHKTLVEKQQNILGVLKTLSEINYDTEEKQLLELEQTLITKQNIVDSNLVDIGKLEYKKNERSIKEKEVEKIVEVKKDIQFNITMLERQISIFKNIIEDIFNDSIKLIEYYSNVFIQKAYPNYTIHIYRDTESKRAPLVYDFICNGVSRNYKRLSGGQKTVADISLRLGFSQALMDRAKTKINFVALDEPFESLDEHNRESIKSILTELRGTFEQIFIISHTPDAQDCEHIQKVFFDKDEVSFLV